MPPTPLAVEAGVMTRILRQKREVMISLAALSIVVLTTLLLGKGNATVLLLTNKNESRAFPDMEAVFAPHIPAGGVQGVLYAASPLNSCSPLTNHTEKGLPSATFALVARGSCNFDVKVKNVQDAGFAAAIVFDTEDGFDELVTMSGSSDGIYIYAVFVSWLSGESLLQIVGDHDTTCIIQPDFEDAAWSIMAVSFISLVAVSAVLATLFFVRRQQLQHLGTHLLSRVTSGMSATQVKSLPSIVFQGPGNGSGTAETCAICLEDYEIGEKLRLLPCNHEFHVVCIDRWLLARRPFCPVCKRDARTKLSEPAVSETTPLLAAAAGHTLPIPVTSSATQTSMVGSPPDVATQSQSSTPDMSLYFSPQGVDLC